MSPVESHCDLLQTDADFFWFVSRVHKFLLVQPTVVYTVFQWIPKHGGAFQRVLQSDLSIPMHVCACQAVEQCMQFVMLINL